MAQLQKKFIGSNQVDGSKIRLLNNQSLRARNAADSADVEIVKVNASNTIEFLSVPQVPSDPTLANDLVRKSYVDQITQGLKWKDVVRVASTANVNIAAPGAIDGVSLAASDRVLLKNQSVGSENGIYVFNGSVLNRATDADTAAEVLNMAVFASEGTSNADRAFVCTTDAPITLGSTALTFIQFSSAGSYSEGDGIDITGQVVSVQLATDPGLEFNSQQLRAKVQAPITRDSNGIGLQLETTNPSLQVSSGELGVKIAASAGGLQKDAAGLKLKIESSNPSVQINGSNELGVLLNTTGSLEKTASGLRVRVDGTTQKINGSNQLEGLKDNEEIITLTGTDIANQYIDLAQTVYSSSSITLHVIGGIMQQRGVDYTISTPGVTRITFANDLASGGNAALVTGDIVVVRYTYL